MKLVFLTVPLLVFCELTISQEVTSRDFSFKGNNIGMSLADFRALPSNQGAIWINTGDPRKRLDKSKSHEVSLPLCSDQYQFDLLPKPVGPGEVVCITGTAGEYRPSPGGLLQRQGGINEQSLVVSGHYPQHLWYRFLNGNLYGIDAGNFLPSDFSDIVGAFVQRYGAPDETSQETYQNAFGAKWVSSVLVWRQGDVSITLTEGPGNGPGQEPLSRVRGPHFVFLDERAARNLPDGSNKNKVDF